MKNEKQFKRATSNKMIAGVCAGIGEYFDIDPTIVRIAFVFFTLFGGSGVVAYIILWILLPEVEESTQVEQNINLENVADDQSKAQTSASTWIAVILIGLGGYFLLRNLGLTFSIFDVVSFRDIVPIALIVGGIYLFSRTR